MALLADTVKPVGSIVMFFNSTNFRSQFLRCPSEWLVLKVEEAELHQTWIGHRAVIGTSKCHLDFRYIALFWKMSN